MVVHQYVGKTLSELAEETHIFSKTLRVFVLSDVNDTVGRLFANGYSVKEIIRRFPFLSDTVVCAAEKYYGETILRVCTSLVYFSGKEV